MTNDTIERLNPVAWIIRHKADTPDTRPALYFTEAEAVAHAAQYLPGVAVVVPLGDMAAARAQGLEEAAKACDARVVGDHNREDAEAARCAAAIRALKDKP